MAIYSIKQQYVVEAKSHIEAFNLVNENVFGNSLQVVDRVLNSSKIELENGKIVIISSIDVDLWQFTYCVNPSKNNTYQNHSGM